MPPGARPAEVCLPALAGRYCPFSSAPPTPSVGESPLTASFSAAAESEHHGDREIFPLLLHRKCASAHPMFVLGNKTDEILLRTFPQPIVKPVRTTASLSLKFGILHAVPTTHRNFCNIQKITPGTLYSEGVLIMSEKKLLHGTDSKPVGVFVNSSDGEKFAVVAKSDVSSHGE